MHSLAIDEPIAVTTEQPESDAPACCACKAEEAVQSTDQTTPAKANHSHDFHCTHTADRLNPGHIDSNNDSFVPSLADVDWATEELFTPATFSVDLKPDISAEIAPPSVYARTLPLLS